MAIEEQTDVLVVGAGISGLTAAVCLQAAGLRVRVLEGAEQIGGRVQAISGPDQTGVLGDLGPTWVWPRWQPVVARWMSELALTPFSQYDAGDGLLDGFGGAPRRHPIPGQEGIARIIGGPTAIIGALAARLMPEIIQTNARVERVEATGSGLRCITSDRAVFDAARVVLATPLRVTSEQIRIEGLPRELSAAMRASPTWMAQHAKAVALYPSSFWREAGLSGRVASRTGPLVEVHDHTPATDHVGALFGFVGWDAPARAADPTGLRQAILAQLVRCFGAAAENPLQLVIQDWAVEPLIFSKADQEEPAQHPDVGPDNLRRGHLGQRLWFAVSETAAISPGLIEGAFSAGETAAAKALGQSI